MASAVDVKKQSEDLEPAAGTLGLYGGRLGHVYGYGSAGLAGPLYSSGLGFAGLEVLLALVTPVLLDSEEPHLHTVAVPFIMVAASEV